MFEVTENALRIRDYFDAKYGLVKPPATSHEITKAELDIGMPLPSILRELYRVCNGFGGPLGSWYLAPLNGEGISLVKLTNTMRDNPPEEVSGFVSFGMNAADHSFAMQVMKSGVLRIVYCDPEAPKLIDLGQDLFQVYLDDEHQCERDLGAYLGR